MVPDQESGRTYAVPYATYDPGARSWKTSGRSSRGGSTSSLKTWPASGMTSGGRLFELPAWEPPISASGGSESRFPTPRASDGPHGGPNQRSSKGEYDALPGMVVNMLPTPIARDWKPGTLKLGVNGRPLSEVVLLLKTPTANLGRNGAAQHPDIRKGGGTDQPSMMRSPSYFPTPTAADGTGGPGTSPHRKGGMNLRTAVTHLPNGGASTCPPSADGST